MKRTCGFSWADEVEKEEQISHAEKAKKKPHEMPNNPFSSATPREVLEIDWRKPHQDHTRSFYPREKKMKENIPKIVNRGPEIASKLQNVPNNHRPDRVSVLAEHQAHDESCAPPLMYPPRNYADLVRERHCARRTRARRKKPRNMNEAAACGDEKDAGNVREENKREGAGMLKAKSAKKPTPSRSVDLSRNGEVNVSSTSIGGRHKHVAASLGGLNMEKGRIDGDSWRKETLPTSSNEAQRSQQRQHEHGRRRKDKWIRKQKLPS